MIDLNNIPQIRNREEERKFRKILSSKGKSKAEIDDLIKATKALSKFDIKNLPKFKEYLLEGDKVKLNVERIKSHLDYNKLQQEYRDFVENNADVIFTVEYDKKHTEKPNLVCFKEDTSRQHWLWWDGDLLVLDERDGVFKELYMINDMEDR